MTANRIDAPLPIVSAEALAVRQAAFSIERAARGARLQGRAPSSFDLATAALEASTGTLQRQFAREVVAPRNPLHSVLTGVVVGTCIASTVYASVTVAWPYSLTAWLALAGACVIPHLNQRNARRFDRVMTDAESTSRWRTGGWMPGERNAVKKLLEVENTIDLMSPEENGPTAIVAAVQRIIVERNIAQAELSLIKNGSADAL